LQVLFIGASPRIAKVATFSINLRWPEVRPLVATTATEGLRLAEQASPDLVLLHPDFADMTLSEAVTQLRYASGAPLIILGHEKDETEVLTALELGADDYIRLPCDLTEIMARIWALVRRSGKEAYRADSESPVLISGRLLINTATYEVLLSDRQVNLTPTEFRLLSLLIKNRSVVMPHRALEDGLWGGQVDNSRLVKKYVQRLRRKLEDDARDPRWIASVHGVGYRFIGPSPIS
jgi:two-component system KDP operon response regulator KdpE